MAATTSNKFDLILGIVLIALGVLVLVGYLEILFLKEIVGVALIVVGVVMLVRKQNAILSIVLIALGVLVLASRAIGGAVEQVLTLAAGILLLVGGILKIMGKW